LCVQYASDNEYGKKEKGRKTFLFFSMNSQKKILFFIYFLKKIHFSCLGISLFPMDLAEAIVSTEPFAVYEYFTPENRIYDIEIDNYAHTRKTTEFFLYVLKKWYEYDVYGSDDEFYPIPREVRRDWFGIRSESDVVEITFLNEAEEESDIILLHGIEMWYKTKPSFLYPLEHDMVFEKRIE
jgi:hypothetical protein